MLSSMSFSLVYVHFNSEGSPMQLVPPVLPHSNMYEQFSLPQQFQQQATEIPVVGASVYSQQLQV